MLVTTLDLRYSAFHPTPDEFSHYGDYEESIKQIWELLAETIYMENKLALKGFDFSLMDETF